MHNSYLVNRVQIRKMSYLWEEHIADIPPFFTVILRQMYLDFNLKTYKIASGGSD